MNFNRMLKDIYNKLNKSNYLFDSNVEESIKYLNSFPEPISNFERSYFQYCCQTYRQNILLKLLQNLVAYFILLGIKTSFKKTNISSNNNCDAILLSGSMNFDYVPEELKKAYPIVINSDVDIGMYFHVNDKSFIKSFLLKYNKQPFFVVKCLLKLGEYSKLIHLYNPKAILVNNEFSFTSSFLTEYCSLHNVKHINIMHGEKLLYIRDSFVNYHNYYVWDIYYVNLLVQLRAQKEIFKIAVPDCLKLNFVNKHIYKFTYYLGAETEEELLNIRTYLLKLSKKEKEICVRMHPRYSNIDAVRKIFSKFNIEDNKCSLATSFGNTECVISLYSTVLYQAFLNKKDYMIDDCSNPEKFKILKSLKYIMLEKGSVMMSKQYEGSKL